MKSIFLKSKLIIFIALLGFVHLASAQSSSTDLENALGFSETVNDVPEAPINFIIPLLIIAGLTLAYFKWNQIKASQQ